MVKSRKPYQYQIVQFVITDENNILNWTEEDFKKKLNNEVVIGYIYRLKGGKFGAKSHLLNLYTINQNQIQTKNKEIDLTTLQNKFIEWIGKLKDNPKTIMFRNPPVKEWMETKENWCKKLSHKLAQRYNLTFDECLSSVYMTVMKCYSKPHVYMGNLSYIEVSAHNDIKMNFRFMKNRLNTNHPNIISLDAEVSDITNEDNANTFHELVGKIDPYHEESDTEDLKQEIIKDLKLVFSEREIDQIINMPGYLTMSLYRKLLKWRKTHKRSDYFE